MSMIIDQKTTQKNYYYIEQENNILKVGACERQTENFCGYPFISCSYNVNEIAKAKSTFKRYIKKYN
jgi:hypothetical protein